MLASDRARYLRRYGDESWIQAPMIERIGSAARRLTCSLYSALQLPIASERVQCDRNIRLDQLRRLIGLVDYAR